MLRRIDASPAGKIPHEQRAEEARVAEGGARASARASATNRKNRWIRDLQNRKDTEATARKRV